MATIESLNLSFNPFQNLTPHQGMRELIWAGIDDIKEKIDRIYTETIRANTKQIVLNWGPYGGGKTYSAYYFIQQKKEEDNLKQIYIKSPKDGASATDQLFRAIVDELTFEGIQNQVSNIVKTIGEEDFVQFLSPITSKEYAKAIALLSSDNEETIQLLNRFLYAGLTKAELKKVGLAKEIKSETDKIKFLTGLLTCYTWNDTVVNGRVVLWIDEMEDLIYYTPKTYKTFSQILRELIDNIRDRLLLFMNFTLSEGEENTIELILGGAVWDRITRKIRFRQFEMHDAEKYCAKLLETAKINKQSNAPFEPSTITEILKLINPSVLIPREINKYFNSLIVYCLDNDINKLNQEHINKWIKDYSHDN